MRTRPWPTIYKVHRSIHLPHTRSAYSLINIIGEGENEESWPVEETLSENELRGSSSNFAPRGASRFQERVRNRLPRPLDLNNTRHRAIVETLYSACSVWRSVARGSNSAVTNSFQLSLP